MLGGLNLKTISALIQQRTAALGSVFGRSLITSATAAAARTALGVSSTSEVWSTGDLKVTLKTAADAGWVMFDDGTIGDGSSAGSSRANADCSALFTLLWNNTTDANCAVSTGRGASAAADFAAHKTIALPKSLGRALAISGAGAGLTARALAEVLGSEDAVVVQHNHAVIDPNHAHVEVIGSGGAGASLTATPVVQGVQAAATNTSAAATGITIGDSGVSGVGANLGPRFHANVMVKL